MTTLVAGGPCWYLCWRLLITCDTGVTDICTNGTTPSTRHTTSGTAVLTSQEVRFDLTFAVIVVLCYAICLRCCRVFLWSRTQFWSFGPFCIRGRVYFLIQGLSYYTASFARKWAEQQRKVLQLRKANEYLKDAGGEGGGYERQDSKYFYNV